MERPGPGHVALRLPDPGVPTVWSPAYQGKPVPVALVRSKPAAASISEAMALPAVTPPAMPVPRPPLPLLSPVPANGGYLRRCTFRKMEPVTLATRRADATYSVTCLYPDRETPQPLGDLASARAICDGCAATGIFRPDED